MNCKFCGAELDEGSTLCSACGKENAEEELVREEQILPLEEQPEEPVALDAGEDAPCEPEEAQPQEADESEPQEAEREEPAARPKNKGLWWKILLAVSCGLVLLAVLTFVLLKGLGIEVKIPKNDLHRKSSYTAADTELEKTGSQVVARIGGKALTNRQLQIYYWSQVHDFLDYFGTYTLDIGLDESIPLDQQKYPMDNTMTWQQYFLQYALQTWQRYQVLVMMAEEAGMEPDPEMLAAMQELPTNLETSAAQYGYESADALIQAQYGPGVTVDDYVTYMITYYTALQYFNLQYESVNPNMTELDNYYREHIEEFQQSGVTQDSGNLVDVRHILIMPTGGTKDESGNVTYSDEEWETCYEQAKSLLDEWLAGEATEDSFADMAYTYSEDGSYSNGGLYTQVREGQMVPEFNDWIFDESRQPGDNGLVRTQFGYHIMYFVGSEEAWVVMARTQYVSDRVSQMIDDAIERWPMKVTYSKIAIGELALYEEPDVGSDFTDQPTDAYDDGNTNASDGQDLEDSADPTFNDSVEQDSEDDNSGGAADSVEPDNQDAEEPLPEDADEGEPEE